MVTGRHRSESFGVEASLPQPGWVVLDAARDSRFTGEMVFDTWPEVRVHMDRGSVYLAETEDDPSLGARLVDSGLISAADLERGSVSVGGDAHLGQLFERVPHVDRAAVLALLAVETDECVSWVAAQRIGSVQCTPYRHHRSGMHVWFSSTPSVAPAQRLMFPPDSMVVPPRPEPRGGRARSAPVTEPAPERVADAASAVEPATSTGSVPSSDEQAVSRADASQVAADRPGDADAVAPERIDQVSDGTVPLAGRQRVGAVDARVDDARVDDARVDDARVDDARVDDARVDDARVDDARVDDADEDLVQWGEPVWPTVATPSQSTPSRSTPSQPVSHTGAATPSTAGATPDDSGTDWIDRLEKEGLPADDLLPSAAKLPRAAAVPLDRFELIWPSGEVDEQFGTVDSVSGDGHDPDADRVGPTAVVGSAGPAHLDDDPPTVVPTVDTADATGATPAPSDGPAPGESSSAHGSDHTTSTVTETAVTETAVTETAVTATAVTDAPDHHALAVRRAVASVDVGSLGARRRLAEAAPKAGRTPLADEATWAPDGSDGRSGENPGALQRLFAPRRR